MAADSAANLQLFSPPGSGRSSPAPRATRNAAEDALYKKDKSFRRYALGVDRTLALWDTAQQEWADYISFLGRLLKALQAHPPETPVIPHSDTVALRLAQCLNPALPSGVHQKVLEVYAYIFTTIGEDALARDLNLYLPGLATTLSFASLSVRPLFLSIFENHILKLSGDALRPALKAVILSLLPGLEDETSEDFERMVLALDKLRNAVQDQTNDMADAKSSNGHASHFWQCFFLASITNASRRQGALAFLTRRLPRFGQQAGSLSLEAEAAVHPEPGLLIRCFESGLSDPQLLIQRGFLDLIVSHLPLDSPVLQQSISKADLERLVAAAASVVSRRDMSLNRRLWAWFLGPEPSAADAGDGVESPTQERHQTTADPSTIHAAYFSRYGLAALTTSVLKLINRRTMAPAERARPFRVCLSLMDRWEVGGLIVPELFLPALQSVHTYSEQASKEQVDEVMRSASAFFDGVDSGLIWGKLTHLVTSSLDGSITSQEALRQMKLAKFVLARFNLKEEDMLLHHMPLMIVATLTSLGDISQRRNSLAIEAEVIDLALEIAESLVQGVPDRALRADQASQEPQVGKAEEVSRIQVLEQIAAFYEDAQAGLEPTDQLYEPAFAGRIALRQASHMTLATLQADGWSYSPEMPSKILANLIVKTQNLDAIDDFDFASVLQDSLSTYTSVKPVSFSHLVAIAGVLVALQVGRLSQPYISPSILSGLLHQLLACLWHYLSPTLPKYHVEATLCVLQLHSISPSGRLIEAAIAAMIAKEIRDVSTATLIPDCGRRFAVLWTHTMHELSLQSEKRGSVTRRPSGMSLPAPTLAPATFHSVLTRPLLLLLDTLAEEGAETATFVKSWLLDLPTLGKVFEVLALHLQSLQCLAAIESLNPSKTSNLRPRANAEDDTRECLYYLGHIFHMLKRPSQLTWATLAHTAVTWDTALEHRMSLQEWLIRKCLGALSIQAGIADAILEPHIHELHRIAISIISQIYQSPFALTLRDLEVEVPLIVRLKTAVPSLQSLLLGAILSSLRIRVTQPPEEKSQESRPPQNVAQRSTLSLALNRDSVDQAPPPVPPPSQLIECLKFGFSSPSSRLVLDDWVQFLIEVLPMFADTIFESLLPLVECFCKEINDTFDLLKITFAKHEALVGFSPETTLVSLINGLEQILAKAHDRLMIQETQASANKTPEVPQGFFSNVVSGVFAPEANQTRTPTANSRLTVLLCFQDTVRICFAIWSWGGFAQDRQDSTSASSFSYTSLRMRNRARRLLEHLFAAEALECLETLVVSWAHTNQEDAHETAVMGLLNVLNGSRPKLTIPAIFNAIYSRTDPNALDSNRMSTLTSDLSDTDLVAFLVDYTRSLEDDAMDEIWQDCTLFLRDVLANPLPHRQILPTLLEFTAVIGQKVDNTTFGEQRKMRRELADIFARILTATFTTRPMGYAQDASHSKSDAKTLSSTNSVRAQKRASEVVAILTSIVPNLPIVLADTDRVTKIVSDISTSVIGPTFRAKAFPENVSANTLDLLHQLTKVAQGSKLLKKDIYDAFNDSKFFNTPLDLIRDSWLPILSQWTQSDKERVPELLSRLTAPTTAGIMFGVGASSARQEADRKAQTSLRRISLLILASPEDAFTPNIPQILEKIVELLTATPSSSPSSATRADVFVLLRSVVLKTSPIHLAPVWPVVNGELTSSLSSLLPDVSNREQYTSAGIVQACKLLDELVVLDPDDFQLIEWLYLTDTIDAVYKPSVTPALQSLTDEINEVLSQTSSTPLITPAAQDLSNEDEPLRTLSLDPLIRALEEEEGAIVYEMPRTELMDRIIRPFLGNLAMGAFESRYGGGEADWKGIWESVVRDAAS
ncbi:Dopey, N-terminal-domain-containing protein [Boeremia exigua]|uniref:Dopey, N-terminal-domain-containing protein n=1 Tax=Boeremia exigua TaxID=749465 RepID=UPI001E8E7440|nr:Dopey, N-terminal-domain-containing protein [Boeremia exigua]KAH6637763.1 Dopey, N-terminal-domain-containing protein [Boeremia exigua]